MDLLFKRYASPYPLLDEMILAGELFEFVMLLLEQVNEEQEWEFFLHKVFDKSYHDFKEEISMSVAQRSEMSESEVETTVNESKDILANFTPQERRE